ncbi:hypothetical protein Lal_00042729 [Lupinus albus]|nr:hypothetical protein Lal_00042729 [Lupinus albus]
MRRRRWFVTAGRRRRFVTAGRRRRFGSTVFFSDYLLRYRDAVVPTKARKSRLFKISDLTLSLKRGISRSGEASLAQARILSLKRGSSRLGENLTASTGPECHFSHPGETTLAQARVL